VTLILCRGKKRPYAGIKKVVMAMDFQTLLRESRDPRETGDSGGMETLAPSSPIHHTDGFLVVSSEYRRVEDILFEGAEFL
jgi:hypothetical protein